MLILTVFKFFGVAYAVGSCSGNTSHFGSSTSDATWCGSALQKAIGGYLDLGNFSAYLSDTNDCSAKLSLISATNWNNYKEIYRGALETSDYLPVGSGTAWTSSSNGSSVNYLDATGSSSNTSAPNAACRTVLPTIILDQSDLCIIGGSGTMDNPYIMAENEACGEVGGVSPPNSHNGTYMQNFTAAMCEGYETPIGTGYTLVASAMIDSRDNKTYEIRKFADGKCWMAQNLKYGGSTISNGIATDYCTGRTSFSGNGSSSPNSSWYAAVNGASTTTQLYGDCRDPAATGDGTVAAPCLNSTTCGYLYNWQAAMQHPSAYYNSSYTGSSPNSSDICPTGWHVPTGTVGGEFSLLDSAVGGSGNYNSPAYAFWNPGGSFAGVYSGDCGSSGSLSNQGDYGLVWSSTPSGSSYAYDLYFDSGYVYPGGYYSNRYYGFAVRCVRN